MSSSSTVVTLPRDTTGNDIHRGWWILSVAFTAIFMSAPGQSHSIGTFRSMMILGMESVNDTQFSTAYLVGTLVSGFALPFLGPLIDRFGARVLLPLTSMLLAAACILMSYVEHLPLLYLSLGMLRLFGQGLMCLLATWLVGEWFQEKRGLVMGLMGVGGALSVMTFPLLNRYFILNYDWQTAWLVLAAILLVTFVIPPWLAVRNRPEEEGLFPDWKYNPPDKYPTHATKHSPHITRENWTRSEALWNPTFWKLVMCITCTSLVGTGVIFYADRVLEPVGMSGNKPYYVLALQALLATITCIVAGYLTSKIQARYLLATAMFLLAAAMALLVTMSSPWMVLPFAIMGGVHGGIIRTVGSVVWVNYYGREHQGAVAGAAVSVAVAGSALGPLPLAISEDMFGTLEPALILFMCLPIVAGIVVLSAVPPKHGGEYSS
ncbi:MAG: MFS transporter [Planctomycetaceae bacterium]|jgi:MFS family permease|nr:MFS transporter [Planctomycetaceae bacterium]